jgi:hypothetical protein
VAVSFTFSGIGCLRPNVSLVQGTSPGSIAMAPTAPQTEETTMLRKLSLVAVAAASLAVPALAPTSASAWGGHGWHGGGWHHGGGWGGPRFFIGGPAYAYGYGGCYVRRLVPTPWGPRWRLVNRCY